MSKPNFFFPLGKHIFFGKRREDVSLTGDISMNQSFYSTFLDKLNINPPSKEDAIEFVNFLIANGKLYHFDSSAHDIVNIQSNVPIFSSDEAIMCDIIVAKLYKHGHISVMFDTALKHINKKQLLCDDPDHVCACGKK